MNPKQTIPLAVALAPAIAAAPAVIVGSLIGLGILLLLKCLADGDKEKTPEAVPADTAESARKATETPAFRQIPAIKPASPTASVLVPSVPRPVVPPSVVPLVPKMSAPAPRPAVIVPLVTAQAAPTPPIKKRVVSRADMATVFAYGTRTLTRTAAVIALKRLGFGKTAAYSALSPDGRFSAWLHCAPDGVITWTDGQTA